MVKKERVVQQQKEKMKKLLEGAAMGLGFFILFGILIIPGLREGMGTTLNVVLGPLAAFVGNFLITILILSVITGIYTSVVQKYTTNWELMEQSKQYQKQIRELQKELMEAKREDNKHQMKKLEKRKAEIMRKQTQFSGEMMRQQMKPMAYIGIITIPIFMWIWEYVEIASVGPVIFPLIGEKAITATFILGLPYWVLWYMVCSIPIAQMIRKLIGIRSAM
ncbi:MAG: DUF106 domain-containing protein [Methanosarcinales archaeon]|nr:DUF106 domain-containing protein [Methanosarcinales archaeon]